MTDDESLCAGYAFCDPHGGVWREIADTADPAIRERVERQIADCPSGRLQYARSANEPPVEVSYPPTVAVIPNGALWILGGIPVETADGFTYEVRNRQLLCRCGASQNKPFCDSTHVVVGWTDEPSDDRVPDALDKYPRDDGLVIRMAVYARRI